MAISHVQGDSISDDSSSQTIAKAFPSNNTQGNTIVVVGHGFSTADFTISDSQGNSYTRIQRTYGEGEVCWLVCWVATNIKAGANTITVDFKSSVTYRRLTIDELTPCRVEDYDSHNLNCTTDTDGVYSPEITTLGLNRLIFGYVMEDWVTASMAAGTGFTLRQFANSPSNDYYLVTETMNKATAGTVRATFTSGVANWFSICVVSFYEYHIMDAETGDTSQWSALWNNTTGTFSAIVGAKIHGAYGFEIQHHADGSYNCAGKFTAAEEIWVRFYFRFSSALPAMDAYAAITGIWLIDNQNIWAGNSIAYLSIRNNTGSPATPNAVGCGGSGITGQSSDFSFAADTDYYLELHWKKDASAGVFEGWINGTKVFNQTGLNTSAYSLAQVVMGDASSAPETDCIVHMDDCVISASGYNGPIEGGIKSKIGGGGDLQLMLKGFSI